MAKVKVSGPHNVGREAWYYIEKDELVYVQEEYASTPKREYMRTNIVKIPWRTVKAIAAKVTK